MNSLCFGVARMHFQCSDAIAIVLIAQAIFSLVCCWVHTCSLQASDFSDAFAFGFLRVAMQSLSSFARPACIGHTWLEHPLISRYRTLCMHGRQAASASQTSEYSWCHRQCTLQKSWRGCKASQPQRHRCTSVVRLLASSTMTKWLCN